MNTETTIVEINGVKMEVDLRHAKVVHENIRVGSKVKILEKGGYDGPKVHPGVVVGFEPFTDLPTIIVAYVHQNYSESSLKFAYINSKSAEKWDMVPAVDDELPLVKADVLAYFEREAIKKETELHDIHAKRDFFLRHFNAYFTSSTNA
jgi:hypothetical protein